MNRKSIHNTVPNGPTLKRCSYLSLRRNAIVVGTLLSSAAVASMGLLSSQVEKDYSTPEMQGSARLTTPAGIRNHRGCKTR
jgi:hypothetical protein